MHSCPSYFFTQRLQNTFEAHNIDSGNVLKAPSDQPKLITCPTSAYSSVFEMTARLSVAVKQVMVDQEARVLNLNRSMAAIRVVEVLGAGDMKYFGFLHSAAEICLDPNVIPWMSTSVLIAPLPRRISASWFYSHSRRMFMGKLLAP